MKEWTGIRQELYLRAILDRHSPHGTNQCDSCLNTPAPWRCSDCLGNHVLCRECCRHRHKDQPFHRVEFWTGTHYERDWLCNLGVVIHLGHHGSPCPVREPIMLLGEPRPPTADWTIYDSPSGITERPLDCILTTVAANNGIHKVWMRKCSCIDGGEEYQYLELGLYPASYTRIETLFTFDLLQACRLDNLECKASVYHLWSKLRRLTCPFFPTGVPASNLPFCRKMCVSTNWSEFCRIGIRNCFVFSDSGEI
jgi:hypothetical protein